MLAHDGNLELQLGDAAWQALLSEHGIEVAEYRDMAALTRDLHAGAATFAYLPAANDFYLRDDVAYEPVASAVFAADGSTSFDSLLIVAGPSAATSVEDLRGARLGYVHRYCTSTFLAPALLCAGRGEQLEGFFGELVVVPPYQAQIEALVRGECDTTMVEEDVWLRTPANAERARVLARQSALPSPVFIARADADPELRRALERHLLTHRPPVTPATMFAGFAPFQREQVEAFFAAGARALPGR